MNFYTRITYMYNVQYIQVQYIYDIKYTRKIDVMPF